jgi:hypothetical protein
MTRQRFSFLFFALLLTPLAVSAQQTTGPIATALGGAGRAAMDPAEIAYMNPAGLAHISHVFTNVNYGLGDHPVDGQLHQFGILLSDGSAENLFPGALSYGQKKVDRPDGTTADEQDYSVAISTFDHSGFSLGLSGHRLVHTETPGGTKYIQDNASLGLMIVPIEDLAFSFSIYDFLPTDDATPNGIRLVPTYALGSFYKFLDSFSLRLDLVRPDTYNPDHRTNVMFGAESFIRKNFAVRVGWQWREVLFEERLFTAGFGYRGPRLSFDYSFQKDTLVSGGARHLFDLWLPF